MIAVSSDTTAESGSAAALEAVLVPHEVSQITTGSTTLIREE